MGDYDSQVDEELFRRILQIVHKDASGELHKLLTELAATHEHGTNGSKLISEDTFFVPFAKRNLLHVATYNQARKCVRLLVNPPHCWDPDKLDGRNHNPMYSAELRDDIGVLVEIARQSKERRDIRSPSVDKPIYGGFPSTALVWPQDLWVHPLRRDAVIGVRHVGISGSEHDATGHYMFRTQMIGPLVALVFELYIANPSLFAFEFWTGEESDNKQRLFWPVPSNEPDLKEEVIEHSSCEEYPHCLYRISVITRQLHLPDQERFVILRNRWVTHTLTSLETSSKSLSMSPPSLMRNCRSVVRRLLINRCIERNVQLNYVQLVRSLRQPQAIEQFLLYQDIWDVPDWEQYLTDGEGANMPYGIRLLTKRIALDTGETGTLIGHRFIPDH
ncbi:hypothetical protein T265_05036 [Opisthorchis viverrini]|uniref:SOCS box n=2 Tax=Opisthorchis viverrini TaxID=6198 RepID=A0A075AFT0_OPIVI|nr:hypothetical protein T265_05036 [Opisthorchis viverrini]KER28059.1 hypothetical protein T265_05036 [Opisthorchis viverrini]